MPHKKVVAFTTPPAQRNRSKDSMIYAGVGVLCVCVLLIKELTSQSNDPERSLFSKQTLSSGNIITLIFALLCGLRAYQASHSDNTPRSASLKKQKNQWYDATSHYLNLKNKTPQENRNLEKRLREFTQKLYSFNVKSMNDRGEELVVGVTRQLPDSLDLNCFTLVREKYRTLIRLGDTIFQTPTGSNTLMRLDFVSGTEALLREEGAKAKTLIQGTHTLTIGPLEDPFTIPVQDNAMLLSRFALAEIGSLELNKHLKASFFERLNHLFSRFNVVHITEAHNQPGCIYLKSFLHALTISPDIKNQVLPNIEVFWENFNQNEKNGFNAKGLEIESLLQLNRCLIGRFSPDKLEPSKLQDLRAKLETAKKEFPKQNFDTVYAYVKTPSEETYTAARSALAKMRSEVWSDYLHAYMKANPGKKILIHYGDGHRLDMMELMADVTHTPGADEFKAAAAAKVRATKGPHKRKNA